MNDITILGIIAIYLIFILAQHFLNWVFRLSNKNQYFHSEAFLTFTFIVLQFVWIVLFYAFTSTLIETY